MGVIQFVLWGCMAKQNTRLRTLLNNRSLSFGSSLKLLWYFFGISSTFLILVRRPNNTVPILKSTYQNLASSARDLWSHLILPQASCRSQVVDSLVCCEAALYLLYFQEAYTVYTKTTLSAASDLWALCSLNQNKKKLSVSLSCWAC